MKLLTLLISTTLLFNILIASATDGNGSRTLWGEPKQITGSIYVDMDANETFSVSDLGIQYTEVEAFEDVNRNGQLDEEDIRVGKVSTDSDGQYAITVNPNNIKTISTKVNSSTDDAVQNEPGGIMILDGVSESGVREIGLRFTDVNIPQGAKVTDARLKITLANGTESFIEIIVSGEASDNSTTFINEDYNIHNRARTSMVTAWHSQLTNQLTQELEIDEIGGVIQEIIDRTLWTEGNALTLIIADFNYQMYMFDGGFPAELIISYEETDLEEVGYIIAPLFENIDPSYELFSEASQFVLIDQTTEEINNVDFVFNTKIITSNANNVIEGEEISVSVYPTITTGTVNVNLTNAQNEQEFSVQIYSMNGKLMAQDNMGINNGSSQQDLSGFSKGTYIVQISDGTRSFTERVIVQ